MSFARPKLRTVHEQSMNSTFTPATKLNPEKLHLLKAKQCVIFDFLVATGFPQETLNFTKDTFIDKENTTIGHFEIVTAHIFNVLTPGERSPMRTVVSCDRKEQGSRRKEVVDFAKRMNLPAPTFHIMSKPYGEPVLAYFFELLQAKIGDGHEIWNYITDECDSMLASYRKKKSAQLERFLEDKERGVMLSRTNKLLKRQLVEAKNELELAKADGDVSEELRDINLKINAILRSADHNKRKETKLISTGFGIIVPDKIVQASIEKFSVAEREIHQATEQAKRIEEIENDPENRRNKNILEAKLDGLEKNMSSKAAKLGEYNSQPRLMHNSNQKYIEDLMTDLTDICQFCPKSNIKRAQKRVRKARNTMFDLEKRLGSGAIKRTPAVSPVMSTISETSSEFDKHDDVFTDKKISMLVDISDLELSDIE